YARVTRRRAKAMEQKEKGAPSAARSAFTDQKLDRLRAVKDVRADPGRHAQPLAPRGSDIIGVVPQHVVGGARHRIGHGEASDALRAGPGGRRGIDPRELAV